MLDKVHIEKMANACINDKSFVVDVSINNANQIKVCVDSFEGITIDECVRISRCIEGQLDREKEDFALEVSSAGLTQPFKVVEQYRKNLGKDVEVVTREGLKLKGKLTSLQGNEIGLELIAGKNKSKKTMKELPEIEKKIAFKDIKSTKLIINF
jgi:ribosome maturation factor RimP